MRGVVEERKARVGQLLEIEDVQRGGTLIEAVAILARIEAEEGAEEEADRRLVGDDEEVLPLVALHEIEQGGEGARRDLEAGLAARGREGVGVGLVPLV